jgi:hypothetical protein
VEVSGEVEAQAMAMPGTALRLPKPFGIALDTARLLG